jgi:nucleotide-binding universal stress UspA family protein
MTVTLGRTRGLPEAPSRFDSGRRQRGVVLSEGSLALPISLSVHQRVGRGAEYGAVIEALMGGGMASARVDEQGSDAAGRLRILLAVDGSRGARQALSRTAELFGDTVSVTVLNVVPSNAFPAEQQAQERLLSKSVSELEASGVVAAAVARTGDNVGTVIIDAASELQAHVIVMGSRGAYVYVAGRGDESRLGSVCAFVLGHADRDVLVVKERRGQ